MAMHPQVWLRSALRVSGAVVVLTTVLPAAGCASRACSAVGAEPGVGVTLTPSVLRAATTLEVRACLEDACASTPLPVGESGVFVVLPELGAATEVTLRVEVRDVSTDTVIGGGQVAATTETEAPNGPGCDPVVGRLRVTASTDGLTLT